MLAVTLAASTVTTARAIDSPGGTPAPTAATPVVGSSGAKTAGGTGVSTSTTLGTGGSSAAPPSTSGTGGSEYGVIPRKTPSARKVAVHKPTRSVRHVRGKAKSKVKAPAKPKAVPVKHTTPALPVEAGLSPGAPTPVQTEGEGAVFPVAGAHSFGDAANRFNAGRTGHLHQGQDVLANEGLTVLAPLPGTIITTGYQAGGAGWYVAEHLGNGLDLFFAHCQAGSLAVSAGQAVAGGQSLCRVGQTGDATGPHLHLEIWVGGWQASGGYPIDPLPYLEAWDRAVGG